MTKLEVVQGLSLEDQRNLPVGTVVDCEDDWIIQKSERYGRDGVCWITGKRNMFGFSLNGEPRSQTRNCGEFATFGEALRVLQANRDITDDKIRQSLRQEEVDDEDSW